MLRNIHEASRFLSIARYSKGNILLMIAKKKKKKKDHVRGILGRRVSAAFFCAQPLLCEVLIESAVLISSDLSRESAVSRTHVSIGEANGFSDGREPNWLKSITELESEGRYLLKSALMGELCGKSCSLGCRDCH